MSSLQNNDNQFENQSLHQSMESQQQQSLHNSSMGLISKKDIEQELDELFTQLKIENTSSQISDDDTIDQSTLISLLLYLGMDSSDPDFFQFVKGTLDKYKKATISRREFKKMFMEPEISFQNLNNDEMSNIFKIFDRHQKGSFSADDFLMNYKQTADYAQLTPDDQIALEERVKKDFEIISPAGKEITPIEFYKILQFQGQE